MGRFFIDFGVIFPPGGTPKMSNILKSGSRGPFGSRRVSGPEKSAKLVHILARFLEPFSHFLVSF